MHVLMRCSDKLPNKKMDKVSLYVWDAQGGLSNEVVMFKAHVRLIGIERIYYCLQALLVYSK